MSPYQNEVGRLLNIESLFISEWGGRRGRMEPKYNLICDESQDVNLEVAGSKHIYLGRSVLNTVL